MNNGTSPPINISGQSFTILNGKFSSVTQESGTDDMYPVLKGTLLSEAMMIYQNPYRDFAFQKITPPYYGNNECLPRYTGIPANDPDFIADNHFIGIMRLVDRFTNHHYEGFIGGTIKSIKPS